jgi:hypothetical protein
MPPSKQEQDREHWAMWINRLELFRQKTGHYNVPKNYQGDDPELGIWARRQRKYQQQGILIPEHFAQLDSYGFRWSEHKKPEADRWEEMFGSLVEFHEIHGHCRVPRSSSSLRSWVHHQRKLYKKGKLEDDRYKKLNDLNYDWGPVGPPEQPALKDAFSPESDADVYGLAQQDDDSARDEEDNELNAEGDGEDEKDPLTDHGEKSISVSKLLTSQTSLRGPGKRSRDDSEDSVITNDGAQPSSDMYGATRATSVRASSNGPSKRSLKQRRTNPAAERTGAAVTDNERFSEAGMAPEIQGAAGLPDFTTASLQIVKSQSKQLDDEISRGVQLDKDLRCMEPSEGTRLALLREVNDVKQRCLDGLAKKKRRPDAKRIRLVL